MKKKINENTKVTLTFGQLKRLVKESDDSLAQWSAQDRALKSVKKEIVMQAKTMYLQMKQKFIDTMSEQFIKNNLSVHSDRPQDAAENLWDALEDGATMSSIMSDMYLFDGGDVNED